MGLLGLLGLWLLLLLLLLLLSYAVHSSGGIGTGTEVGLIEGYRVWPLAGWGREVRIGLAQDLARLAAGEIG